MSVGAVDGDIYSGRRLIDSDVSWCRVMGVGIRGLCLAEAARRLTAVGDRARRAQRGYVRWSLGYCFFVSW